MEKRKLLQEIAEQMTEKKPEAVRAFLGFDGFIDEVVHVIDKRYDTERYSRLKYLKDYGDRISAAAGLSLNIEMLSVQRKLGGNGPILANSLAEQGCKVTYIGALGKESIHPVFHELEKKVELISLSDPGQTDAIEFLDGKIISSKLESLNEISWETLSEKVGIEKLTRFIEENQLIGFENWTMIVHMTDIWKHIADEILPKVKSREKKTLFIDLADPEKRTDSDILEALDCLKHFEKRFDTVLGLNEKEACEISLLFGKKNQDFKDVLDMTEFLWKKLPVSTVVVHPVREACAVDDEGAYVVEGPYCDHPVLTTGAGDNFNAGFIMAKMLGFSLGESLAAGTANSGFYVRAARSAKYEELQRFIMDWSMGRLE